MSVENEAIETHDAEMQFDNFPNRLTLARIAFVPFVVGLLFLQTETWDLVAAIVFGIAAITDYFDGYIARSRKLVTVYGKLMDPLADKFLVVCSLVMLQHLGRISPIVVMLLVCRELAITGLRALASAEGVIIAASGGGKWKTVSQMVAIPFIMVKDGLFGLPLYPIGKVLLWVSLAMSLWSAKDYVIDFFKALTEQRKLKAGERKTARQARIAARAVRLAEKALRKPKAPPTQTS
jgi:CDP-diacylglycerol--glycerol-3-phosphate 3-phosphatidyltransferase